MMSNIKSGARQRAFAVVLVLVGAALCFTTPASTQEQAQRAVRRHVFINGLQAVDGEVLVKYRQQPSVSQLSDVDVQVDTDETEKIGSRGLRRLHSRRFGAEALIAFLETQPDVEYVEPNYVVSANLLPNDPMMPSLWGLFSASGVNIDAPSAWNYTTGSRANVVAVIDTGVDYNHPDLAANIWSAPSQFTVTIGGQSITCAAGTHGFNAINRTCNPMDDNSHGTHVSGTIGGVGNNGVGVTGVNWTASIMGLKFLGANGSGSTSDAINAMEFAIQAKTAFGSAANVRVLSNSWGGGGASQALADAINNANANNMLFVAAAGNNASNNDVVSSYPANYNTPNMISVAATDSSDQIASFSNYGHTTVHLGAPGVGTLSTTPGNTYSSYSGTSMATPHVSGAAALVLSACPSLTTAALKSALLNNVDLTAAMSTRTSTGGRLNVARAVVSCLNRVSSVTLAADKTSPQASGTAVSWTAAATGGTAPYQYKWWIHDGTAWTVATGWSTANTFTWTPTVPNASYQVGAWARSSGNLTDAPEASTGTPFAITGVSQVSIAANKTAPQAPATTITWTATPTGGTAPYQYKWWIHDGTTWTMAADWSATNTFAWTPMAAKPNWQVGAWVRGAGNTADSLEASVGVTFAIAGVSQVSLSSNKTAPQAPGTTVTWTATPTGGTAPHQYKWLIYNGTTWTTAVEWSTATTFAWIPTSANANWQVGVWVRGAGNTADARESSTASAAGVFAIVNATQVSLATNKASPQAAGTTIIATATATLGTAPYQYKWLLYNGTTWTTAAEWSTTNTFAWTPTAANLSAQIGVWVRSAGNTVDARETPTASAAVTFAISGVSQVSIAANKAAPQTPGTTITWTATPTGGTAPYQYKWLIYDGTTWTMAANWSTTNTLAWTPATVIPNAQVGAWVRSAGNSADAFEASVGVPFAISLVTQVSLSANKTAPQATGTTVTWTATPTGGAAPHQFKWLIYNGTAWTTAVEWSTLNTFAWTPTSANANWQVGVWVRSAGNTVDARESSTASVAGTFAIVNATQVSLSVDRAAPQAPGTAITATATATLGTAPYQYKWLIYDGTTWTTGANWSTSNSFVWTPMAANPSWQVGVWVRSAGNTVDARETATASAAVPFAIVGVSSVSISPNRTAPQAPGTTVTWTATAAGGAAPYQYKWLIYNGTTWTAAATWTTSNTFAWTPSAVNPNWQVGVWVRSAGNTVDVRETSTASAAGLFPIQ